MPWRTACAMDQRTQFVAAWLQQEETVSALCRRFGISRKTGYKVLGRYAGEGPRGLMERSHAPHRQPQAVPEALQTAILRARAAHRTWGPRKLRAWLARRQPERAWPAASTIGALLQRHGLTVPHRRRQTAARSGGVQASTAANTVWAVDFKGWFRTRDGQRCDPLTITDIYSRYLLRCQLVARPAEASVRPLFEATFREYGLPERIRSDNGPPFASIGAGGLSRLAVWWIRLGIRPERIAPGHPEQNGEHERMHRTLKAETTRPAAATPRAQQGVFDRFRRLYNGERPHEALGQVPPATWYTPSLRPYPDRLPPLEYPETAAVRRVRHNGEIKWHGGHVYLNKALAGELVGVDELADGQWRVCFGPVELGWLDAREPMRLHAPQPPRDLSPISSV